MAFWRALFRRALRIFFRRIEVEGAGRVPRHGPVIFVANHPNALVDPLLLLCFAPRPVAFLAKAPLFRMPVVGFFVRVLGSIPVYRRQDAVSEVARNRETFEAAGRLLAAGGALALFPEGVSHDEPSLLPMKTGAARIALGAAAALDAPIQIVPSSLAYTWKQKFRSSVLIVFGDPITAAAAPNDARGEPARESVTGLTGRIGEELERMTLQAKTAEALDLVRRAERIYAEEETAGSGPSLADRLARSLRIARGYQRMTERNPGALASLEERVVRFESERRAAGLSLDHLKRGLGGRAAGRLLLQNLITLFLLPLAVIGVVAHYPAYRFVGWLARSVARREQDVLATAKIAAAMLLFPATWLAGGLAIGWFFGYAAGLAAGVLLPLSGWAALRVGERLDELAGQARALLALAFSRRSFARLLAERGAIRREMERLDDELSRLTPDG
jgi:1-acyl-sn-glycerol-3-phosphate acyltransferase